MAANDCPLLDVAAALSPFIKSRDEVASIRRELQSHLLRTLSSEETTLSSLNLNDPGFQVTEPPSASLTGVRKAYWKALQAHSQAREKYEALRAELDQIKHGKSSGPFPGDFHSSSPHDDYVTLLRQREKHRKLKVIDRALSSITPDTSSSTNALEDIVTAKLGDLPPPPVSQPSMKRDPEVEAKVMELKKAIVSTKRRADEQRTRTSPPPVNGANQHIPQGEVAGLQKALQELTIWMENQLTLIANAEANAQTSKDDHIVNGVHAEPAASMIDVEKLYDQYLEARHRLIETINDDTATEPAANGVSFDAESSGVRGIDAKSSTKTSAEILLPFMPALISAKQEEQAYLQQSSHTRKQMAAADAETANLIRRLAGESHLVQPGATQGDDWITAGIEAGSSTETFVKDQLIAGERAAQKAKTTLDSIQSLPDSLQRTVG